VSDVATNPQSAVTAARRVNPAAGAAALGAGALVALSLPPWGWWPLAFVGIALLDRLIADRRAGSRAARTWLFGLGWMLPGLGWMWFLSAPGYVVASAVYAGYLAAAAAGSPGGRWRVLGLPAAITLAEALRFAFPFGGVPLASLAISQAAGPLAGLARIGGALLLTWATVTVGLVLAAVVEGLRRRDLLTMRRAAPMAAAVLVLLGLAWVAPDGRGSTRPLLVAVVQGGGPQGTRAINTDPREVFERHLAATRLLAPGPELVLWPENVIDVPTFAGSPELAEVAAEAARLGAPISVGVTEDAGDGHFTNAQVVVLPDGTLSGRYDKVRRVPFGEYMPLRRLLTAIGAPTDLVPRDAIAGTGPAVIPSPVGPLGVVISWEVFFGGRARDAIGHGGEILTNPTNGSSYTGAVLQSQQVASSRLRAIESGRWVAQAAPTGFSAFVSPSGHVLDRTGISEQAVRVRQVERRTGTTWYVRFGDTPVIALAAAVLTTAWLLAARDRRQLATPPAAP
jgi:apolipoprotein N-acyltransferase